MSGFGNNDLPHIGFCGEIGAGKSEGARYLAERYSYIRVSFSSFLLDDLMEYPCIEYTWPKHIQETMRKVRMTPTSWMRHMWNTKPWPADLRLLAQWWGTEKRRAEDPDYWVNKARTWINFIPGSPRFAFENVRFENELRLLQELHGKIVLVTSDRPAEGLSTRGHISEQIFQQFPIDYEILNNGSIEDLHRAIDRVLFNKLPNALPKAA